MRPRDLSAHTAYEAGRGIEEVARERGLDPDDLVKLSSNENPHGPSPRASEAIRAVADSVHTYPKRSHTDLIAALTEQWGVSPKQVWLANGGDGALDYLSRALLDPGDEVLVSQPGFAYYAMSARYHHGRVNEYHLSKSEDFAQTAAGVLEAYDGERIVYLTSPHNPTGSEISSEGVLEIAEATDGSTLTVLDEAYGEFTTATSAAGLIEGQSEGEGEEEVRRDRATGSTVDGSGENAPTAEREDVAVLRTFSKAHGLAGLRLGYAITPASWADAYARVNTPFAASEVACRAGLAALSDAEHVERTVSSARWAREYMHEHIDAPTYESGGNFVLCEVGDAAGVAASLQEKGVIVRDCSSFGLPECIRITCGTREETHRAVGALDELLKGQ
ncbi:histidinol-phosphate transaminase [Halobacteriales archaeon QS_3_64_16]|nr:MAG: histidinol-phosphate transaminase [Halobacteriales archaeon QS_3_64_16]